MHVNMRKKKLNGSGELKVFPKGNQEFNNYNLNEKLNSEIYWNLKGYEILTAQFHLFNLTYHFIRIFFF